MSNDGNRTQYLYKTLGWFTSIRLFFVVRLNRFFTLLGYPIYHLSTGLSKITWLMSLSYGLELLIDLGLFIKNLISPANKYKIQEKPLSFWPFLQAFIASQKRHYRIINATVWFGINFVAFFFSGEVSIILNFAGFIFDLLFEVVKSYLRISALKQDQSLDPTIKEQNLSIAYKEIMHNIAITSIILIGMGLIYFSPAGILTIIGAGLALSGSVFGGLGQRIFDWIHALIMQSYTSTTTQTSNETNVISCQEYLSSHSFMHKLNSNFSNQNTRAATPTSSTDNLFKAGNLFSTETFSFSIEKPILPNLEIPTTMLNK